jgi:hypothetical protein
MLDRLDPSNPKHAEFRLMLRLAGPSIAAVGLVFLAIGLINFFWSFGHEPPRLFWCAFVGGPIFMVGLIITKFAFMGAVSRYMANEVSPVGKDVANYMAHDTKESVRDLASAVAEGFRSGDPNADESVETPGASVKVRCRKCRALNDEAAKFCNQCGGEI